MNISPNSGKKPPPCSLEPDSQNRPDPRFGPFWGSDLWIFRAKNSGNSLLLNTSCAFYKVKCQFFRLRRPYNTYFEYFLSVLQAKMPKFSPAAPQKYRIYLVERAAGAKKIAFWGPQNGILQWEIAEKSVKFWAIWPRMARNPPLVRRRFRRRGGFLPELGLIESTL